MCRLSCAKISKILKAQMPKWREPGENSEEEETTMARRKTLATIDKGDPGRPSVNDRGSSVRQVGGPTDGNSTGRKQREAEGVLAEALAKQGRRWRTSSRLPLMRARQG